METLIYPYIFNPLITEDELDRNECTNGIYLSASQFRTLNQEDSEEMVILQVTHNHVHSYAHIIGVHQEEADVVYAPSWMIQSLGGDGAGDFVTIERVHPSLGTKIKIEPHSTEYADEDDPIAVLTHAFENYSCVAPGQDIVLNVNGKRVSVNIVSTNAGGPICIRGMEIEVEIESPEPEPTVVPVVATRAPGQSVMPPPVPANSLSSNAAALGGMFDQIIEQPSDPRFPGKGYRLDGK